MESSPLSSAPWSSNAVADEVQSLQSLLQVTVCALLVLTTSVSVYLLWQYRQLSRELTARKAVVETVLEQDKKLNSIAEQFGKFGASYPDFQPILQKYGLKPLTAATGPVSTGN